MKKVMLFLMLAVFTLSMSSFTTSDLQQSEKMQIIQDNCFSDARILVEIIEGEVNINNIDTVLWLTAQCEMDAEILYYPWN